MTITKTCRDCKLEKPITEFSPRQNYNKSGVKYMNSFCKHCLTIRARNWQKKNPVKYKTYQDEYKEERQAHNDETYIHPAEGPNN